MICCVIQGVGLVPYRHMHPVTTPSVVRHSVSYTSDLLIKNLNFKMVQDRSQILLDNAHDSCTMHVFDMYVPVGVGALAFLYYMYGEMEEAGLAKDGQTSEDTRER